MRLQTYYLIQYLSMNETKITSLESMMPFEFDETIGNNKFNNAIPTLTEEDWKLRDDKFSKMHPN
jgi:hypothetical protein